MSSPRRACPSESNAPALINASMVRLLQHDRVDLAQEVGEVAEAPLLVREATIEATTLTPTLRMADSPKRMSVPVGVKSDVRGVHIRRQHLDAHPSALGQIDGRLVLVIACTEVSNAAMYSAG